MSEQTILIAPMWELKYELMADGYSVFYSNCTNVGLKFV
jgi:hypothetical protein